MIVGPMTSPRLRARRFMISGGVASLFGVVSLVIFTSVGAVANAGVPAIIVPGLMLVIGISSGLYGLYLQSNLGEDADVPQLDFSRGGRGGAFIIAPAQPTTALLGPGQQQFAFPPGAQYAAYPPPQQQQQQAYVPQQQHQQQPYQYQQGYTQPGYAQPQQPYQQYQQQQQVYLHQQPQQQYPPSYEVQQNQQQHQQTYVVPSGSTYDARP